MSSTVAFPAVVPYPENPHVSIDAIPIGIDEHGHVKTMALRENAIICAGSPGSGKSGFLNTVCEGAVRCGNVRLAGVDLKRVELSNWAPCFDRLAVTLDDALDLLESVHNLMEERYQQLERKHLRKVEYFDSHTPLVLLVIDEAAALLTGGDKKKNDHAKELLRSIISLGRAAGVTVVFASQRVSANIISSDIRDIAKTRVSYSVTNIESAKMVLGDGLKADEQGPWRIGNSPAERGVCYMQDEADRSLVCVKTFWLDDTRIQDTVRRYGKPSPAMREATREVLSDVASA
jgi:S-DNA-T family DNA segregation ATPase FtsK/SpoIIIE